MSATAWAVAISVVRPAVKWVKNGLTTARRSGGNDCTSA